MVEMKPSAYTYRRVTVNICCSPSFEPLPNYFISDTLECIQDFVLLGLQTVFRFHASSCVLWHGGVPVRSCYSIHTASHRHVFWKGFIKSHQPCIISSSVCAHVQHSMSSCWKFDCELNYLTSGMCSRQDGNTATIRNSNAQRKWLKDL